MAARHASTRSISAFSADSASGVSMSIGGRGVGLHPLDRLVVGADQVAGADVAVQSPSARERSGATTAPDCRACRRWSAPRSARPRAGSNAAISRSIMAARHLRHVGEADDGAVGLRPAAPRCPVLSEVDSPSAKSGLCTKRDLEAGERLLDAARAGGRSPRSPGRRCEASASSTAMRTSGLPPKSARSLFGPAHAARLAGREHDRGDPRARPRGAASARLRPRHDLHQQSADAHAGDVVAASPSSPASSRVQDPVEPVLLRASARSPARRAPGGPPARRPAADCPDRPACRNARSVRRAPRSRPGSRRARSAIAEAPNTRISSAPACSQSRGARRRARAASCGTRRSSTMRGAGRRQPVRRDASRLVHDLVGLAPAACVDTTRPSAAATARRETAARAACAATAASTRSRRRPRRE